MELIPSKPTHFLTDYLCNCRPFITTMNLPNHKQYYDCRRRSETLQLKDPDKESNYNYRINVSYPAPVESCRKEKRNVNMECCTSNESKRIDDEFLVPSCYFKSELPFQSIQLLYQERPLQF